MLRNLHTNFGGNKGGSGGSGNGPLGAPRWALGGLGIAAVLALVFGIGAFTLLRRPEVKNHSVEKAKWEQTAAFDYAVLTQPSTLYPSGIVGPVTAPPPDIKDAVVVPPPVYTKGARKIDVGFNYALKSSLPPALKGEISADLQIKAQGEGGWSKTQELLKPTAFEGATTDARVTIDLAPVQALIETIEKETGFTPSGYDLVITPRVKIAGNLGSQAVEETFAPAFTVKYTKTTITADSNLRRSEPKSISAPVSEVQHTGFLGQELSIPTGRLVYSALTLLTLAAAGGFAAVVFLGVGQDEATQVRARYGMRLVPVTEADNYGSNRVQVARLQDLAVLAQRDGKIVFNQKTADGELYFVPDGAVTYEYMRLKGEKGA